MSTYSELLKDPRWQKKRLEVFDRDQWQCQCCLDNNKTLHVHHTKYFPGPPWETPDNYLITLCETCHKQEEYYKGVDFYAENLSGTGLTRFHLMLVSRYVRFIIETKSEGRSPFWTFQDEVSNKLIPGQGRDFVKWLNETYQNGE